MTAAHGDDPHDGGRERRGMTLACGDRVLDLSRPRVMGVLNVTPDSFSDGGRYSDVEAAVARAAAMAAEGAAIIDVGGESTRPGALPVPAGEQLRRVLPVVEAVTASLDVIVSVDTSEPAVMAAAVAAGAGMINDVRALRRDGALAAAAGGRAAVCLMHMQGEPATMQLDPRYGNVVTDVRDWLAARVRECVAAGIAPERLAVDPGFGFGKTLAHNMSLLRQLDAFQALRLPLVVGLSRKSMLGRLSGAAPEGRLYAGLAAAVMAVLKGAAIVRTHDVGPTVQALTVCHHVRHGEPGQREEGARDEHQS